MDTCKFTYGELIHYQERFLKWAKFDKWPRGTFDDATIEDAFTEAVLLYWANCQKGKISSDKMNWKMVFTIGHRKLIDEYRRLGARPILVPILPVGIPEPPQEIDERLGYLLSIAKQAFDQLKPVEKDILSTITIHELKYHVFLEFLEEDLSPEEARKALDVKRHEKQRALKKLRKIFKQLLEEDQRNNPGDDNA
ncbi:MAG: hypothetical protein AAFP02_04260 [Bacteroidota bacterium]